MAETKISLGFVITLALLAVVVIGCILAVVFAFVIEDEPGIGIGAVAFGLAWAIGTAAVLWPWDMQYHQWRMTEGKIATANSRILSGDNGPDEQYVIKFLDGRQRRCDDSRCASLKPGDYVRLWCIREWQWASEPGWGCRWGGSA